MKNSKLNLLLAFISVYHAKIMKNVINVIFVIFVMVTYTMLACGVSPLYALIPSLLPYIMLLKRAVFGRYKSNSLLLFLKVLLFVIPIMLYNDYDDNSMFTAMLLTAVSILPVFEKYLFSICYGRGKKVNNLPGIENTDTSNWLLKLITVWHLAILSFAVVMVVFELSYLYLFAFAVVEAFVLCRIAIVQFWRAKRNVSYNDFLRYAVTEYEPKFILYFSAPRNTEYQVKMWIDYLERMNQPFIIMLRLPHDFTKISNLTDQPVIVCKSIRDVDNVIVPSMTTVFYVNNGMYNMHMVRNAQLTHVQLLHGDSDKAFSYNPVTAMYDKVFVAGQAGIDRYHTHGVDIPPHKFEIVGRPQVENVLESRNDSQAIRTVLYAPTWKGNFSDTSYSSLSLGVEIIQSLLSRGMNVIFRPHPYSYKDPAHKAIILKIHDILKSDVASNNREHVWGDAAESHLDVFGCFNNSDALISDVSSVVPDFLFSCKPFAIVAMTHSEDEFVKEFPLARASYVVEKNLANIGAVLDELLIIDSKKKIRQEARVYYLGPFDRENYADNFVNKAKSVVLRECIKS